MTPRVRTGYSFRSATGHLEEVADRLIEIGMDRLPMTDTASTFGWRRWRDICEKKGVKPVFGVELAVSPNINAKKPAVDHWTFIAKDDIAAINKLVRIATFQFRYQPLLSYRQAMEAEGVYKIVGHRSDIDLIKPSDDLYVALSPAVGDGYFQKVNEAGLRWIPASDNRYTNEGDQAFYEVLCGRSASLQSYPQHILSHAEWIEALGPKLEEISPGPLAARLGTVLGASTAQLKHGTLLAPDRPATLLQMCKQGAKKLNCDINRPTYKARLEHELKLIEEKNYEDYFYIIADVCQWARERMCVGPARGSSCGSLVCYLLGITTVDPIPYDLIFERFIDVNRDDLPDIDIDFSDTKRQMVFDYMSAKYGAERVARLGVTTLYKPRSALNEAGAALDIPPWEVAPVLDSIIERSGGDSRALQATEDTLNETESGRALLENHPEIKIAGRMEGHPRHYSQHAAGVIVTEEPVENYVAVDFRSGATMCDKKDAEDLELLKIDALGLTQLSIFEDALELAGLPHDYLDSLQPDDPKAFDVLNSGHFSGVFQFMGLALQSITQQVKITAFEDIVSITALARPGPLNTGGTNHWIKVKTGVEPLTYPHEAFRPFLENTLGVVAYQEQVMQIGREIGDLSWGDVTALRKAMSKSLGKEFFDQYGDKWKDAAIRKGIPEDVCNSVWDDLCAYGAWAFNRSHAVAYGLVSYYCCWLKAHYPLEYAAAMLTHTTSIDAQISMLRELHEEGITYTPVDPEASTEKWRVVETKEGRKLIGPLTNVLGIGPKVMNQILEAREKGEEIPSRAKKILANPQTKLDSLWPVAKRINDLMPEPRERGIVSPLSKVADIQDNGQKYTVTTICVLEQIKPKDENEPVNVAKRGYKFSGPTQAINLRLKDDTDVMFAKINRFNYEALGKEVIERGRPGKSIYVVQGEVPANFRMIDIRRTRYIGDMEKDQEQEGDLNDPLA